MSTLEAPSALAPSPTSLGETLRQARRCIGTRKDGGSCGAPAQASGLCIAHDPATQEEARAARVAGGIARRVPRANEVIQAALEREAARLAPQLLAVYEDALTATRLQSVGFSVVETPDHAIRMRAADTWLDRVVGKPVTRTELTGADGGPVSLVALLAADARDTI